jgi:hypothetical protein
VRVVVAAIQFSFEVEPRYGLVEQLRVLDLNSIWK